MKMMYDDYTAKNCYKKVSYEYYRKEVRAKNISFTTLGNEECENCTLFYNHASTCNNCNYLKPSKRQKIDNINVNEGTENECNDYIVWKNHIQKASKARNHYRIDKTKTVNDEIIIVSADMQKVVMLPRLKGLKTAIFCKRLIAFNETFANIGSKSLHTSAVLWNEAIAGRTAEEVTSSFYKFLKVHRNAEDVIIWLDNCSSQNKCWVLYSSMIKIVNSENNCLKSVIFKYFEPGHTFMSADSIHANIEKQFRLVENIEDFGDYMNCIEKSSKQIRLIEMTFDDFLNWPDDSNRYALHKSKVKLESIVSVKFARGSTELHYKKDHDDESFSSINFRRKNSIIDLPSSKSGPRGIPLSKKDNIVNKLCPLFKKKNRCTFWEEIAINDNSVDLTENYD